MHDCQRELVLASFSGVGGGLLNNGGTVTLINSTISANRDETFTEDGGAVLNNGGTVTLTHTIIAGNTLPDDAPADCAGTFTSLGHNLVGAGTGCPSNGSGDLTVDPAAVFTTVLGPLQNNGGPTQPHALLPRSLAIDAGTRECPSVDSAPLTTDQRGTPRPIDGNGDGIPACDIGAIEFQEGTPVSCQGGRSHIRGWVRTEDATGVSGVTLTLDGPGSCQETATTKERGFYLFPHLRDGTYTVTPNDDDCTFEPPSWIVTLEEGPARLNFEAICP
jgi:SdrD B-like domain